jgi:Putative zinc-finger
MKNENFHPSDQQLLLYVDGELPAHRTDQIRAHLRACWDCRSRMAEMESTIADFMQVYRRALDPPVPPIDGPRAQLKARLAELARSAHQNQGSPLRSAFPVRRLAYVCALSLLIVLGAWMLQRRLTENQITAPENAGMLPNPSLTPGATTTAAVGSICSMSDDEVVAPVSGGLQQKVFKEYGIAGAPTANYEIDYLITPGLGGSGDIRNLWPEPRYDIAWNSFVKDQLEEYLHRAVCGGRVSLPVAQHEIANNWIAAYKKYFRTDRPLSAHLASRVSMISSPSADDREHAAREAWSSPDRRVQDWGGQPTRSTSKRRLFGPLGGLVFLVLPFLEWVRLRPSADSADRLLRRLKELRSLFPEACAH